MLLTVAAVAATVLAVFAVAKTAEASSLVKQPNNTGLVAYYPLSEGGGDVTMDMSGQGNNGTVTPGSSGTNTTVAQMWTTSGKFGNGMSFDGTDDYVSLGTSIGKLANFTMSMWVKPTAYGHTVLMMQAYAGNCADHWGIFARSGGNIEVYVGNGSTCQGLTTSDAWSSTLFPSTAFTLITATGDGTTLKYYRNGLLISSTAQTVANSGTVYPLTFGSNPTAAYPLVGRMDDVRVYNRALSAAEVTSLYQRGFGVSDPSLIGYWAMNEGTGTVTTDGSGSGNSGTLTNGPTWTTGPSGSFGSGITFDGSNDYIDLGSPANLNITGDVTVAAWFKANGDYTTAQGLVGNIPGGGNVANYFLTFGYTDNKMEFWNNANDKVVSSATSISNDNWHHYVGTRTGSTNNWTDKIYIDGVLDNTVTGSTQNPNGGATDPVALGRAGAFNGYYLKGSIDDVRIYSRALSAAEIAQLYANTTPTAPVEKTTTKIGKNATNLGLVGYWPLNDGSGTLAADATGQGNTGTLTNGPTWTTGQIGQAITFDGTNDYVALPNLGFSGNVPLTVSFWANANTNTAIQEPFSFGTSYATGIEIVRNYPSVGQITCFCQSGTQATTNYPSVGVWHHIVGVSTGSVFSFYIDGALAASTNVAVSVTNANYRIGASGPQSNVYPFDGKIDDVRIYNRALSAAEVTQLYNQGAGFPSASNLVGYWPFGEGTGTTTADASGNSNTGTLTNGPTWTTAGKYGNGISFDGVNDYVSFANPPTTGTGSFSIFAWIKTSVTGTRKNIISYGTEAGSRAMYLFVNTSNQIAFDKSNVAGPTSAATVTDGNWHYVGVVNNASTVQIYVDGVSSGSSASLTPDISGSGQNAIGFTPTYLQYFTGTIDDVRIYNTALTAGQVWNLYQNTTPTTAVRTKINSLKNNSASNLQNGLVLWHSFDGNYLNTTTSTDSSGQGNNGTLTNGPVPTLGKLGQALNFDGTNDYVDVGNTTSLTITGGLTISVWAKASAIGDLVGKWSAGGGYGLSLEAAGYRMYVRSGGVTYSNSGATGSATDNIWRHIVSTFTPSGNIVVYINGLSSAQTGSMPATIDTNTISFSLGFGADLDYFGGSLDDVRVYNRALSASEVLQLYNMGK